jgi:hypothetical protein
MNEQKIVDVWMEGIKMEVTVFGTSDMTKEEWEDHARQVIKERLLSLWNAYCE